MTLLSKGRQPKAWQLLAGSLALEPAGAEISVGVQRMKLDLVGFAVTRPLYTGVAVGIVCPFWLVEIAKRPWGMRVLAVPENSPTKPMVSPVRSKVRGMAEKSRSPAHTGC